jgi:hypothetical protein
MKHILTYETASDKENKEDCIKTKLHDLYASFIMAGVSTSLMMKRVGHTAYMVKMTNEDNVSVILVKEAQEFYV